MCDEAIDMLDFVDTADKGACQCVAGRSIVLPLNFVTTLSFGSGDGRTKAAKSFAEAAALLPLAVLPAEAGSGNVLGSLRGLQRRSVLTGGVSL